MTDQVKARDNWWGDYSGDISVKDTKGNEVVVVPKSAYDAVVRERDELRDSHLSQKTNLVHRALYDQVVKDKDAQIAKLKEELADEKQHVKEACAARDQWLSTLRENSKLKRALVNIKDHAVALNIAHKIAHEALGGGE